MITLYHAPNTRSSRVLWLLEEMGVPYETIPCGVRDQPEEMRAHNPSRTVPVMTDGDLVLTESVTMLEYIAATYGPTPLAMTPDEPGYWDYRQLLLYGEATLSAPLNAIVGTTFFGPEDQKDNWTLGLVRLSFKKRLGVAARRLADSEGSSGNSGWLSALPETAKIWAGGSPSRSRIWRTALARSADRSNAP